ncbi:helix-turn-helix domain-containing protein [Halobacillus litoralis]|uniref:Helix-turn-helix domain-containing protein n=1 Tax=Halobacillus litoralis TaxID=45668 RepID=A0A845F867_9BACI|nr:helix-turn-helix transcriptional regulator [Halobacillus litoralis]MYL69906.1 helix-turn-helix domain-containing protein [Halobacillus litoralis]
MIGENIQNLRKQRGMSLTVLAEYADISKSYLSNIERNLNKNPSVHMVGKIADVLEVSPLELLGLEQENEIEPEWLDFIHELKRIGVDKERIKEYKLLIDFINWQHEVQRRSYQKIEVGNEDYKKDS